MPYEGDSPAEAWEYWFDEPPSETVKRCLAHRRTRYGDAELLDAIEITGMRVPMIEGEDNRLMYVSGVLRRKTLSKIDPERATEETTIDVLRRQWLSRELGDWEATREEVREWLRWLKQSEIALLIRVSDTWDDFAELIRKVVHRRREESGPADTAMLVIEIAEAVRRVALAWRSSKEE